MPKIVIINTSPIFYLHRIGYLHILEKLYGKNFGLIIGGPRELNPKESFYENLACSVGERHGGIDGRLSKTIGCQAAWLAA